MMGVFRFLEMWKADPNVGWERGGGDFQSSDTHRTDTANLQSARYYSLDRSQSQAF